MVGIRLIIIMAIVGGMIAYIADHLGSKIGKKRLSVFGLRPKYTSVLLTVLSGVMISVLTIGVVAMSSQSARTALFGMEKIQKELLALNQEKAVATDALEKAKQEVESKNSTISDLDKKIEASSKQNAEMEAKLASLNESYTTAQSEVASLTEARKTLTNEVQDLEKTTQNLRKGIVSMREGQLYYRAGEVIYAGVLRGDKNHQQNINQINWLLQNANDAALRRLGIENKDNIQAIWVTKDIVDRAVDILDHSKGNMLFRVRTIANIFVGELAACDFEVHENQFIYPDDSLILSETYDLKANPNQKDNLLMAFLTQVNHQAVKDGVLPDPLTGKVGNMNAATMIGASNAINRSNGHFTINAYAKGDITTAGPVTLRLEVVPINE